LADLESFTTLPHSPANVCVDLTRRFYHGTKYTLPTR
jgi:hypothetical protein